MAPPDLQFRPASNTDVDALHTLIESAYRGESAKVGWTHEADLVQEPRTTREALLAVTADPNERLLIALRGRDIIGCVQLTRRAPYLVYLGLLTVDPRVQAGGLGKRILAYAEADAARHFGATIMQLSVVSVRSELLAYYERRGYALTGETRPFPIVVDPPLILLMLEKRLAGETARAD